MSGKFQINFALLSLLLVLTTLFRHGIFYWPRDLKLNNGDTLGCTCLLALMDLILKLKGLFKRISLSDLIADKWWC